MGGRDRERGDNAERGREREERPSVENASSLVSHNSTVVQIIRVCNINIITGLS